MASRLEHRYYIAAWAAAALLVLVGFSRTYFLRPLFTSRALPLVLHLHGLLMTSWLALFFVQTRLIAAHRVRWHRRLGIAGAVLAPLLVAVGMIAAVRAQRLGHRPPGISLGRGLYAGFMPLWVFAGLVAAGLLLRRRSDWHKRLMLLATFGILQAAVGRLPFERLPWLNVWRSGGPLGLFRLDLVLVYACVAWDTVRHRRLHPAFGWGLLAFVGLENVLAGPIAGSAAWRRFSTWLVS